MIRRPLLLLAALIVLELTSAAAKRPRHLRLRHHQRRGRAFFGGGYQANPPQPGSTVGDGRRIFSSDELDEIPPNFYYSSAKHAKGLVTYATTRYSTHGDDLEDYYGDENVEGEGGEDYHDDAQGSEDVSLEFSSVLHDHEGALNQQLPQEQFVYATMHAPLPVTLPDAHPQLKGGVEEEGRDLEIIPLGEGDDEVVVVEEGKKSYSPNKVAHPVQQLPSSGDSRTDVILLGDSTTPAPFPSIFHSIRTHPDEQVMPDSSFSADRSPPIFAGSTIHIRKILDFSQEPPEEADYDQQVVLLRPPITIKGGESGQGDEEVDVDAVDTPPHILLQGEPMSKKKQEEEDVSTAAEEYNYEGDINSPYSILTVDPEIFTYQHYHPDDKSVEEHSPDVQLLPEPEITTTNTEFPPSVEEEEDTSVTLYPTTDSPPIKDHDPSVTVHPTRKEASRTLLVLLTLYTVFFVVAATSIFVLVMNCVVRERTNRLKVSWILADHEVMF